MEIKMNPDGSIAPSSSGEINIENKTPVMNRAQELLRLFPKQ